jgi:hypothetical protein
MSGTLHILHPDMTAGAAERPLADRVVFWSGCVSQPPDGCKMPHSENDHIVKSTNEVRAAVTGHNVRYVLLVGTLAVIVLFAVAYVAARL